MTTDPAPENPADPAAAPDTGASGDVSAFNLAGRDNTGVQAGHIGNIENFFNGGLPEEPPNAVDRMISNEERDRAGLEFVTPPGFDEARARLSRHRVLLLRGDGTGRSLSGIRLLLDNGIKQIGYLSPRRYLDSIRDRDLQWGHGYLWTDLDTGWQNSITAAQIRRLATLAGQKRAFVVVVLGDGATRSAELQAFESWLGVPDPRQVATNVLVAQREVEADDIGKVLDEDFVAELSADVPPDRAAFIATLAWEVHTGVRDKETALASASRDVREAVGAWYRSRRPTVEYAMSLAIAVFENRTFREVATAAKTLEEMIDEAELPEDAKPVPRGLFEFSRSQLLENLTAAVARRRHADGAELYDETVHFASPRWAVEAFRHVWREFDLMRGLIVRWMTRQEFPGSTWYCAKALHDVIVNLPTHDPMEYVEWLAGQRSQQSGELAAELLGRLAEDPLTSAQVAGKLRQWCASTKLYRKLTAVRVYGTDYGQRNVAKALEALEEVAAGDERLRKPVVNSVYSLCTRPDNRTTVLRRLVAWTRPFNDRLSTAEQRHNLRHVGLSAAQLVLGLTEGGRYLRSLPSRVLHDVPGDPDRRLVARLFRRVLQDRQTRQDSVRTLLKFAELCGTTPQAPIARGLVQLVDTVAPDLWEKGNHPLFDEMRRDYPMLQPRIDDMLQTLSSLHHRHHREG